VVKNKAITITMSDQSACASGGGSAGADGSSAGADGSAAGADGSAADILRTTLFCHIVMPLFGSDFLIGVRGQLKEEEGTWFAYDPEVERISQIYLINVPRDQTDLKPGGILQDMGYYNWRLKKWDYPMDDFNQKNVVQFLYRTVVDGFVKMIVPLSNLAGHFILVTNQTLYFFKVVPDGHSHTLVMFHQLEASAIHAGEILECSITPNGRLLVINHSNGLIFQNISFIFGRITFESSFEVKNELEPNPNIMASFTNNDTLRILMRQDGSFFVVYKPISSTRKKHEIHVIFPGIDSITQEFVCDFESAGIRIPYEGITKFLMVEIGSSTEVGLILSTDDSNICFLILNLSTRVFNLHTVFDLEQLNVTIQKMCTCSSDPTKFYVGSELKEEYSSDHMLHGVAMKKSSFLHLFAIENRRLVHLQNLNPLHGTFCEYITSFYGRTVCNFGSSSTRGETETLCIQWKPQKSLLPPSQPTLNDAPIELQSNGVFAVLSDGAIVASDPHNGLTLFGPGCNSVASTKLDDAHKSPITSMFFLEVSDKPNVLSYSHVSCEIKIWSIQKRGKTVRLQIVATVSTADIVQKKGVKFLALHGQTLLIVTNHEELLRFDIEITGGIRAEIRPISGPVVQIPSGQICQGIAAVSPTHALIHVRTSGVPGCSLVLVSFAEGAAKIFKSIGIRPAGKPPAVLTQNDFAVSAVDPTRVCFTALAPGGVSFSFNPKEMTLNSAGQRAPTDAIILAIAPCEGGFIYLTQKGSLFRITFSDDKSVVPKKITVLERAPTSKCRLQVSGNTVMICQRRDDGSFELQRFLF
jgi:hypothetical protein